MTGQTGENNKGRPRGWIQAGEKRYLPLALGFLFLLVGFFLGQVAGADTGVIPGSEEDPLVTASWVEARLNAFSKALQVGQSGQPSPGINNESPKNGGAEQPAPGQIITIPSPVPVYEVVVLQPGTRLLTGSGTEFILRSGRAKTLEAPGGGIADLTSGKDLGNQDAIPRGHLLLSPRDDGRGALTETEVIFLIRGKFRTAQ